ncbi:hypothetical protein EON65_48960 [archaeon]|nr:MAG: hypothetical protein EON65_48960 [archaeon]
MLYLLVFLSFLVTISLSDEVDWNFGHGDRRKLVEFHPVVDRGNSGLIIGKTVFAALLHVPIHSRDMPMANSHHDLNAQQRKTHEWLKQHLPMPLTYWTYINSKSCPVFQSAQESHSTRHGHLTSHLLSHFQIWVDWVFFDHDVLGAVTRHPPEYVSSTSYSSISGHFQAYPNLTYTKNEVILRDQDVLWIFEDFLVVDRLRVLGGIRGVNATSTSTDNLVTSQLREAIVHHVGALDGYDIVQLYACNSTVASVEGGGGGGEGDHSPPTSSSPHCPFAYAITRHGARILADEIELCGSRSLEFQIQSLETWGHLKVLRIYGNHAFEYHANGEHIGGR